jgi:hypothetical protein
MTYVYGLFILALTLYTAVSGDAHQAMLYQLQCWVTPIWFSVYFSIYVPSDDKVSNYL